MKGLMHLLRCFPAFIISVTWSNVRANLLRMRFLDPAEAFSSPHILKIGTALTLDANAKYATLGGALKNAFEMYFDWLNNQQGGILVYGQKHMVELILVDDVSSKHLVGRITDYLLDDLGLRILLAPYSSGLTGVASPKANSSGAVLVAAGSSSTSVFQGRPTVFGTLTPASQFLVGSFELMGNADGGSKKTVAIVQEDKKWALGVCSQVAGLSTANNLQLLQTGIFTIPADAEEDATSGVVHDLIQLAPDIVTMCVYRVSCHAMLREMQRQKFYAKAVISTICVTESDFLDVLGTAGQYVIGMTPWTSELPLASTLADGWTAKSFTTEYEKRYSSSPPYQAASAFASCAVLVRAIEDANSTDPLLIADKLREANYPSIFGTIAFDDNGQCTNKMKVVQYQGMDAAKLVYPPENANGQFVYPKPSWADMECANRNAAAKSRFGLVNNTCVECPLGRHSLVLNTQRLCVNCKAGEMGLDGDYQFCYRCSTGSYSSIEGTSACLFCNAGSFGNASGLTSCSVCHNGTFSSKMGQSACGSCLEGTFSSPEGATECERCEFGYYSSFTEATACIACEKGATWFPGSTSLSDCICPQGQYATGNSTCEACLEGMVCPLGSDIANYKSPGAKIAGQGRDTTKRPYPELKPGHWSSKDNPLWVFECENNVRCPGGDPGSCGTRLHKRSCAHCEDGWEWAGDKCTVCTDFEKSQWLFPLLPTLCGPIIIAVMYWKFGDPLEKWNSWRNLCACVAFILLSHYQVISLMASAKVEMPRLLQDILSLWHFSNNILVLFQIGCSGVKSVLQILLVKALGPVIIAAMFAFNHVCSRIASVLLKRPVEMECNRLFNVYGSIMLTFSASIASSSMSLFKCTTNPNGELTLAADLSVICFKSNEWQDVLGIGITACLVYVVGFVSVLVYINLTAVGRFQDPLFQIRWKFLFIKYNPTVWWWSLAFLAKNLLLNLCSVIFLSALSQYLGMLAVTIMYSVMVESFLPYRHVVANKIELLSGVSIVYAACVLIAISYHKSDGSAAEELSVTASVTSFSPLVLSARFLIRHIISKTKVSTEQDRKQFLSEIGAISQACDALQNFSSDQQVAFLNHLADWDRLHFKQVWHFAMVELLAQKGVRSRTHSGAFVSSAREKSQPVASQEDSGRVSQMSNDIALLQAKIADVQLLASLSEVTADMLGADMSTRMRPAAPLFTLTPSPRFPKNNFDDWAVAGG